MTTKPPQTFPFLFHSLPLELSLAMFKAVWSGRTRWPFPFTKFNWKGPTSLTFRGSPGGSRPLVSRKVLHGPFQLLLSKQCSLRPHCCPHNYSITLNSRPENFQNGGMKWLRQYEVHVHGEVKAPRSGGSAAMKNNRRLSPTRFMLCTPTFASTP